MPPVADGYGDTIATQDPVGVGVRPPLMAADPPHDTDFPRIKGEITAASALRLIYGNYDSETKTAGWFADLAQMRLMMNVTGKDQRELHSKPTVFPVVAISERYVAAPGHTRYLLLTSPTWPYGFGCHACEPPVGAAIFKPTESGWRLSWLRKILFHLGDNGGPLGDTKPVRIGPAP